MPVGMLNSTMSLSDMQIEHLDQRAQGIAVRDHQHVLPVPQFGDDARLPEWQYPGERVLERFGGGQRLRDRGPRNGDRSADGADRPDSRGGGGMS